MFAPGIVSAHGFDSEHSPAVTPDGKFMFLIGQGDIYWVEAGFIDKLRPKE